MSVFDLFRGFFGLPGGRHSGGGRREPFFDGIIPDEDDDDDDEDEDAGFRSEHWGDYGEEFLDKPFRFGFRFGPGDMHFYEPQMFGQMFREMEEILENLGHFDRGFPSIEAPPQKVPDGNNRRGGGGRRGNSLRDIMLKTPDDSPHRPPFMAPKDENSLPESSGIPDSPFRHFPPFSRFKDIWSNGPQQRDEEKKDGDLDSQVSARGLDPILTPAPSEPHARSFFKSVTVTKVVKPDGTVEERRTVRDGQGYEKTTVTRSEGPGVLEGQRDQSGPLVPGEPQHSSDMQDEFSLFRKFFGGFKG
ncbi:HCLS1-associated protein X-1 [Hoplias malabaricus]|uniref:HCLS1-associated protein X-1 n=1 Tax=Hoplias malabaricus TaxID=27720 RepID=UPI003462A7B4